VRWADSALLATPGFEQGGENGKRWKEFRGPQIIRIKCRARVGGKGKFVEARTRADQKAYRDRHTKEDPGGNDERLGAASKNSDNTHKFTKSCCFSSGNPSAKCFGDTIAGPALSNGGGGGQIGGRLFDRSPRNRTPGSKSKLSQKQRLTRRPDRPLAKILGADFRFGARLGNRSPWTTLIPATKRSGASGCR
jgi:hypothetical protein